MTEQEEQLLQAILLWYNAEAPEAALILVKGIDQQLNRFHKKMLSHSLKMYKGERNDENRIKLDSFIPYIRKESHIGGSDLTEFLIILALYHFHPKPDDNYLEFNEPLGGFDPQHADERMREAIPLFILGISSGDWQFKEYPEELRSDKEVVLEVVKQDGFALEYASEELRSDKEFVLEAIKKSGFALEYASEALQNDPEIIALAEKTFKRGKGW